jgi:hypothetical protein
MLENGCFSMELPSQAKPSRTEDANANDVHDAMHNGAQRPKKNKLEKNEWMDIQISLDILYDVRDLSNACHTGKSCMTFITHTLSYGQNRT